MCGKDMDLSELAQEMDIEERKAKDFIRTVFLEDPKEKLDP